MTGEGIHMNVCHHCAKPATPTSPLVIRAGYYYHSACWGKVVTR
jgi:hypothetical protein